MWTDQKGYRDRNGMSRVQNDLRSEDDHVHGDSTTNVRDMLRRATATSRQIRIAIVGAGFAGLRCADVLLKHGCDVTIFEARNRLGGRVAQSSHLGHTVDLGPNWIHGTDNNPIELIAKSTSTHLHNWGETQTVFEADSRRIPDDEGDEYGRILWDDGLITEAFRYSNEKHDSIHPNRSLYDFFMEKSETLFLDQPEDVARRKRETFLHGCTVWGAYVGAHVSRQSLKFFWLEECIEGENPFVSGTYTKILEHIARPAQEKATINLNTRVQSVITTPENDQEQPRPRIQLVSDPDTLLTFDQVIVTSPLGWLKNNLKTFFDPPPPPRLISAIENIGYGNLDKIYITFPRAFWNPHTSFSHFLSDKPSWDVQVMNLALTPPDYPPTLLFYIYGDCATHIAQLVSSSKSQVDTDNALIDFLHPYISALPNYDSNDPDCSPRAVLATAWTSDELSGYGSYANFQVGLENGDEDIRVMREGMPERGIWLAGEHTAPFIALGTSTGAYWSGEKVAQRIVQAYNLKP